MKNQKIIFILIGVFCFFALIAGIYAQFFTGKRENNTIQNSNIGTSDDQKQKTQEEIKTQFKGLFNNKLVVSENFDPTNIQKIDTTKDIVYFAYNYQEQTEKYEVDIHLPVINIKGNVVNEFNKTTQSIFANEASNIVNNKYSEKIIYNVNYIASINKNILSLAIESTFKQGENPQRTIIQTYNYDIETGEKIELVDMLTKRNIIQSDCQNKIYQVVNKAQEEAQILVKSGYTVYNRNISDDMYKIAEVSNFYLGEDGELYIIFAYGNNNYTSDMDIVLYE